MKTNDRLQMMASATSRTRSDWRISALLRCAARACLLEREQRTLAVQSSRVSGQGAVRPDDAMAGHHDAQWISAGRRTCSADAFGTPDASSQIRIGDRAAPRDRRDGVPHGALKRRSRRRERKVERYARAERNTRPAAPPPRAAPSCWRPRATYRRAAARISDPGSRRPAAQALRPSTACRPAGLRSCNR